MGIHHFILKYTAKGIENVRRHKGFHLYKQPQRNGIKQLHYDEKLTDKLLVKINAM